MKGQTAKIPAYVLAIILLSMPTFAGRKHGDVENIGNRTVAGKIFGVLPNWVSFEKEISMARCG